MAAANALVVTTDVVLSDATLPVLSSDTMVDGQTLCLYDFGNADSWVDGKSVADGVSVANIVPGGVSASLEKAYGTSTPAVSGGGVDLVSSWGLIHGAEANFDLSALGSPAFVYIAWIKATADIGTYKYLFGRHGQFGCTAIPVSGIPEMGCNGLSVGALYKSSESAYPVGVVRQHAIAWEPVAGKNQGRARSFIDGVLRAETYGGINTMAAPVAGYPLGKNPSGYSVGPVKLYRSLLARTDLIPGTDVAALVAADYAANVGRFS